MSKSFVLSWLAAIIAMLGSLFFSEVMHFIPCTLCWYQRILMYPLTLLIGIALYHNDYTVYKYVLPMSILGMFISGFHYAEQHIPSLQHFKICTSGIPCSGKYVDWFGFITIPLLAFIAFTIITVCMFYIRKQALDGEE